MSYHQEAVLRDGTSVVIRHVGKADLEAIKALFSRMSPTSIHHRFFAAKRELVPSDLVWLDRLDGDDEVALAAVLNDRVIGIGRYTVVEPGIAEVAFDVADADQGRGIGTLLLEHLARIARARGLAAFRAEVEADNEQMLEVFGRSGFPVRDDLSKGIYRVEFPIAESQRFVRVAADRERRAAAKSLRSVFSPQSVAVIGASRTPGSIGRAILDNLIRDGYHGPIYPIHPEAKELSGRRCYASIGAVGEPVDLAVISVPARAVEGVIAECAAAKVRSVVVITAGFAETGARDAEAHLRELVRGAGMRMVGPNCMGVLSTWSNLDATFSPVYPPRGNVSMATQSGALGLAMLDHARELELGIADFVSIGNKADVSVNDVLAYWHDDPHTRVIALYLESFGNPRTFARLAPEVARDRPIVAVKSGRSAAGTRAAASHSAALASLDVGIDALFGQCGIIRVDTLEQMFDVVSLLASQPVPHGNRIGVVTNAGGPGILLADACEAQGLVLPKLTDETLAELRAILPQEAGLANPIDMIASAPPHHYERVIKIVGNDPNVDAVVAIYVPPLVTRPEDVAAAIARGAAAIPKSKPIATVFMSSRGTPEVLSRGERGAIPSYSYPENAAMALASAMRYGAWRRRPQGQQVRLPPDEEQAVRAWVARARTKYPGGGWVTFEELAELLSVIGVRVADARTVAPDPASAVEAARELGFPVVLKAIAPNLVHKTDVGGVALDLDDTNAVANAATVMLERVSASGLLVQKQLGKGVEALVGVTSDPSLGPLLVAGIGGTAVELYKDVAFRVTPVTDADTRDMLDQLRGRALLDGFRGAPPADRDALAAVLQKIAALAEVMPELRELDLNPVIVHRPGEGAVAVDGRLRLSKP